MPQKHTTNSCTWSSPKGGSGGDSPRRNLSTPTQTILRPHLAEALTKLPNETNITNLQALIDDLNDRYQWLVDNTPHDHDGAQFSAITRDFNLISDANLQKQHRELMLGQQDLRRKFRFLADKYRDMRDNLESIMRVADRPEVFQSRMSPIVNHIQRNRVRRTASASSQGSCT